MVQTHGGLNLRVRWYLRVQAQPAGPGGDDGGARFVVASFGALAGISAQYRNPDTAQLNGRHRCRPLPFGQK